MFPKNNKNDYHLGIVKKKKNTMIHNKMHIVDYLWFFLKKEGCECIHASCHLSYVVFLKYIITDVNWTIAKSP